MEQVGANSAGLEVDPGFAFAVVRWVWEASAGGVALDKSPVAD